jgi:hypothetical protein
VGGFIIGSARNALALAGRKATDPDHQSDDWKVGEV